MLIYLPTLLFELYNEGKVANGQCSLIYCKVIPMLNYLSTRTLDVGVSGQLHALATLPPGKNPRNSFNRKIGGPQRRSGRHREVKTLDLNGTRIPTPRSSSP
jgi:hypothetical protein